MILRLKSCPVGESSERHPLQPINQEEKAMPQKTPAAVTGFDGGSTLYDFFDAETGESVLVAHTYSEARFVLGDDFATTTRSLAAGHYSEMPADAFTNRIPNV